MTAESNISPTQNPWSTIPEFVTEKDNPFASDLLDRGQRMRLLCDFARSVSDYETIAVDGGGLARLRF